MKFSVIILTEAGDFLLENEEQLIKKDRGVKAEMPFIFNEEEQAQEVQAEKVFIPYNSIQNIQFGDFDQETV